jgi:hypothetical protein
MTARINATSPLRLVGALVALVAAVLISLWWFVARSAADTEVEGEGRVTVADEIYDFELTTCTAADTDFVAAGYGIVDGVRYWLNASGAGVNITAGTESEIEPPIEGQLWLSSDGAPDWEMTDGVVDAEVAVSDRRLPDQAADMAILKLSCHQHIPGDA